MSTQIGKKHNCLRSLCVNCFLLLTVLFDLGAMLTLKRVKRESNGNAINLARTREHFGYLDEYGVKPRGPRLSMQTKKPPSPFLLKAGRSKRDDPDLEDFYDYFA